MKATSVEEVLVEEIGQEEIKTDDIVAVQQEAVIEQEQMGLNLSGFASLTAESLEMLDFWGSQGYPMPTEISN